MTKPLHALILEDRPSDAELMLHELRLTGFDLTWEHVETREDYRAALSGEVDVILADYMLPQFNAMEALRLLREADLDIPFIVVTGSISEEVAVECMKQGAADYLLKDRLTRLGPAVEQALKAKQARDDRRRAEEEREQYVQELQIINDTILAASRVRSVDGLCDLIAETVRVVNPGAYVIVALYDRDIGAIRIRSVTGLGSMYDRAIATLGADPTGMAFQVDEFGAHARFYATGRLERVRGGIHELLAERFPRPACQAVERLLGIETVCTVGFTLGGKPYGGVSILTKGRVRYRSAVETLVGHLSVMIQQKQAEEALRESEIKFRTLAETAPSAIFIYQRGRFHYVNPAAEALTGYNADELLAMDFWDVVHPDFREKVRSRGLARQQGKAVSRRYDFKIITRDGGERWVDFSAGLIQFAGEAAVVATAYDTTERKQAERALRESEKKYRQLVENLNDIVYTIDTQGAITYIAPSIEPLTGYTPSDVTGRHFVDFIHHEDLPRVAQLFHTNIDGQSLPGEYRIKTKGGDAIWVRTSSRPMVRDGKLVGLQGILTDISERKRMEEELRRQERLAAVGQLAGGIAHDFRNFLTSIILHAQMPLRKSSPAAPRPSPDVARSLQTIVGEARQAANLVQQILDFSRSAVMETEPVDLVAFTTSVAGILRQAIPENIQFTVHTELDRCIVEADPTRVQQALMNLALNARDAMPDGGDLRIELSTLEVRPDAEPPVADMPLGRWVCLSVSDTGTGMTEQVQAHLFEPFFTTKAVGEGTGLGLAQVYGIVKQHEGYIDVDTVLGEGSAFRVYLPLREIELDGESTDRVEIPTGDRETILLVEDSERLRTAGREVLASLGYRVLTARNGKEALDLHRSQAVDLVVTDLIMPEMGGQELVQGLRRLDPKVKALAVTGYVMRAGAEDLERMGFSSVVEKPFDVEELAQAVRSVLDQD